MPPRVPAPFRSAIGLRRGDYVFRDCSCLFESRRHIQIAATPSTSADELSLEPRSRTAQPDARFEVIGAPFSLLSVSLSASQNLYTRRGTLVSLSGKPENVVSTLSILQPFTRALGAIPFLYQRITSTSPVTALISSRSPASSFAVVHLDGRVDWTVAQRSALLAWTGHALTVKPKLKYRMSLANWGNSHVTGRGLLALTGCGQIYQVTLKSGEDYVVHPSNVVAYSESPAALPQPYRFKSTTMRFQIPSITGFFPETRFMMEMRKTGAWRFVASTLFKIRTWARRSIWGDRLFLRFQGPATLLLQSRGGRLIDSMTEREINEGADTPAGAVGQSALLEGRKEVGHGSATVAEDSEPNLVGKTQGKVTTVKFATVGRGGKVDIR